jgi:hypothetical protein
MQLRRIDIRNIRKALGTKEVGCPKCKAGAERIGCTGRLCYMCATEKDEEAADASGDEIISDDGTISDPDWPIPKSPKAALATTHHEPQEAQHNVGNSSAPSLEQLIEALEAANAELNTPNQRGRQAEDQREAENERQVEIQARKRKTRETIKEQTRASGMRVWGPPSLPGGHGANAPSKRRRILSGFEAPSQFPSSDPSPSSSFASTSTFTSPKL